MNCSICEKEIAYPKYRQHLCSCECRILYYKKLGKTVAYDNNGKRIKTGYNQKGEMNNGYKHGKNTEENWYRNKRKDKCERCNSRHNLLVHHKDENHNNDEEINLETLCKTCHQKHHIIRDVHTGKFISKHKV